MRYRFHIARVPDWTQDPPTARGSERDETGKWPVGVPAPDADRGVYGITTAAELVGMGVQTLRLYEARGLLEPDRTAGGTRRYSPNDLDRLRRIGDLLTDGLNLAGIALVLDLEARNTTLHTRNTSLQTQNARLRAEKEELQCLTAPPATTPVAATPPPRHASLRPASSSAARGPHETPTSA
ncbi:MAG: MerR family transcriptional regulator [Actinobacteria bacterium]|nr:MerR family transcriptional regulator [Actinomycetota bacterium]